MTTRRDRLLRKYGRPETWNFDESKINRDGDGQFAPKGTSGGGAADDAGGGTATAEEPKAGGGDLRSLLDLVGPASSRPSFNEAEVAKADQKIASLNMKDESAGAAFAAATADHPYTQEINRRFAAVAAAMPDGRPLTEYSKVMNSDSSGNYTPERRALHEKIMDKMVNPASKVKPGAKPQAVILMGPPGSGKTTAAQKPIMKDLGVEFSILNADDVKAELPEYDGWNAAVTHEESSDVIENDLIPRLIEEADHNVMLDVTGGNAKKLERWAAALKEKGYDVHLSSVSLPSQKSATRAWGRLTKNPFSTKDPGGEPGRFVPPGYVVGKFKSDTMRANYDTLKNSGQFKSWRNVSTDVPLGQKAIPLDQGGTR